MISSSVFALLASAALVASHGIVDEVVIDGVWYPGTKNYITPENDKSPVRGIPQDTGFVRFDNVGSTDIACSAAGYQGRKLTPKIKAGGQMGVRWGGDGGPDKKQWPHPEGPIIVYMASCEGKCSDFIPTKAQFFKIAEEGLNPNGRPNAAGNDHTPPGRGMWAQNRIQYENSYHWFNIPSDIKAGQYLVRHELISLHGAHTPAEGAQYYPSCIQVEVTGGGNATPATTLATKLYTYNDGIVDIYQPYDKVNGLTGITADMYKIPGPPLYVPGKASPPAQPANPPAPAPSQPAPTTAAPSPTKPAGGNNSPVTVKVNAPATATRRCKPKRGLGKRVADETREIYDRALAHAQGAHAHAKKHGSH